MIKSKFRPHFASIAIAASMCLGLAPTALGAKSGGAGHKGEGGGTSGTGTISLVLLNSTDGLPHWGQTVTFNISTTATNEPWVVLKCYQKRVLVAEGMDGYFEGSLSGRNFTLRSAEWTGGEADCTASLQTPQKTLLASTSFHVYP
jgi:hypothetical protein